MMTHSILLSLVFAACANGLRISDLSGDVSSITHYQSKDQNFKKIFVAVFTSHKDPKMRAELRSIWSPKYFGPNVTAKFVLCDRHQSLDAYPDLKNEMNTFGDLILLPCTGGYGKLSEKTMASVQEYVKNFSDHELFMKVDLDAFVSWNKFLKFIETNAGPHSYMGLKNNLGFGEWPFMSGGPGYVLGRQLAQQIVANFESLHMEKRKSWHWEDNMMGEIIWELTKLDPPVPVHMVEWPALNKAGNSVMGKTWGKYKWLTHHHLDARQIQCLAAFDLKNDDSAIVDCDTTKQPASVTIELGEHED